MSNQEAIRELLDLLPQIFDPDGLRRWLPSVPDGDRIAHNLPGGHVPPSQLFFAAADIFRRWGLLGVPEFWDPLEAVAPFAVHKQVVALRAKFGVSPADPPIQPRRQAPVQSPGVSPPPQKITVLLVSASPVAITRMRVDQEFTAIIERMRMTDFRDQFVFVQLQAANFTRLRSALLQHKPHVLHISSHCTKQGELQFEEGPDGSGLVPKDNFLKLLKALRDNLRLVVLNACDSQVIALDLPATIDLAIGMSDKVKDAAAIEFAVSFYEAIGFGRTVENAFDVALAGLAAEIPQLFPPTDADPKGKRQLVLVRP